MKLRFARLLLLTAMYVFLASGSTGAQNWCGHFDVFESCSTNDDCLWICLNRCYSACWPFEHECRHNPEGILPESYCHCYCA